MVGASEGDSVRQLRRRAVTVMVTVVAAVLIPVGMAAAQVPDASPDSSVPGGSLVATTIGWLKYLALAAAIVGLLGGGVAVGVGHFGSNYSASSAGRKWLLGGIGAAAVAGLAHTIATAVYTSTS